MGAFSAPAGRFRTFGWLVCAAGGLAEHSGAGVGDSGGFVKCSGREVGRSGGLAGRSGENPVRTFFISP